LDDHADDGAGDLNDINDTGGILVHETAIHGAHIVHVLASCRDESGMSSEMTKVSPPLHSTDIIIKTSRVPEHICLDLDKAEARPGPPTGPAPTKYAIAPQ
jgi:hypothetical protein